MLFDGRLMHFFVLFGVLLSLPPPLAVPEEQHKKKALSWSSKLRQCLFSLYPALPEEYRTGI